MRKRLAEWNSARDAWELRQTAICGHSAAYSETWPNSGMTVNGVAYELPTWERRMEGSAYLSQLTGVTSESTPRLIRTICAAEAEGGPLSPETAAARGQTLRLSGQMIDLINPDQLLPTLTCVMRDVVNREGDYHSNLNEAVGAIVLPRPGTPAAGSSKLLPTPDVSSGLRSAESHARGDHQVSLQDLPHLLPTMRAAMGETRNSNIYDRPGASNLENKVVSTGARMPRLSPVGKLYSDDRPHDLLSLLAEMDASA